jgi:hypothetical protein
VCRRFDIELVDQSMWVGHACSASLAYENPSGATPSRASRVVSVLTPQLANSTQVTLSS